MAKNAKQFVVIGLGRFGRSIAKELYDNGCEVLGIDIDEEIVQNVVSYVTHAVQADSTDEETLKALGVRNFDVAIVAIGSDVQASIMTSLLLKEMGVQYVLAKALTDLHGKVLGKIGVDRVVFPEREMGIRIANSLMSGHIMDYIELSSEYSIVETSVLKDWAGKTLKDLNLRAQYGLNVVAIRNKDKINISPDPEVALKEEDVLVVIGSMEGLSDLNDR